MAIYKMRDLQDTAKISQVLCKHSQELHEDTVPLVQLSACRHVKIAIQYLCNSTERLKTAAAFTNRIAFKFYTH